MKRILTAFILTLLFSCSAFAAEVNLKSAGIDDSTDTLSIRGTVSIISPDQQLSVMISQLKDGKYDTENIVYINQQKIAENEFELHFPLALDEGYYAVRIGGSGIAKPKYMLIERDSEEYSLRLGDVDADGMLTAADSALTLQYVLNKVSVKLSPLQIYLSNVTHNGAVDSDDAAWILAKVLNGSVIFPTEE